MYKKWKKSKEEIGQVMNADVPKVVIIDNRNKADFVIANEDKSKDNENKLNYNDKGLRKGENDDEPITIEGCVEGINELEPQRNIVTDTATPKLIDSGSV